MLLEFGAKNFFSFREGFQISFRLNASCPVTISNKKSFANTLCIKGANGSGKTNVFKALNFLMNFCTDSFNYKPDEEIPVTSFMSNDEPVSFYITFSEEDVEYTYELKVSNVEVLEEKFFKKDKRQALIIHRKQEAISSVTSKLNRIKSIKLRKNASIISIAKQYEIVETDIFYHFFSNMFCNVRSSGSGNWAFNEYAVSGYYKDSEGMLDFVKEIIKKCDLGISDIKIESIDKNIEGTAQKVYYPFFTHIVDDKAHQIPYVNESSGTKMLYLQLGAYQITLKSGGILAVDEFDTNFHPDILPLLVGLFENPETNPNNAQLVFSTHNTEIMDKLSKYKTVIVSKDKNESFAYRLDEIPGDILRNDRPISPVYRSGKIGGIPRL
ncbi:MAG: ATP-binding protein [Chitinispirillaceae bacterium]|nr:ATP-binding protein [Chitinispirillaceae bacterium]